MPSAPRPTQARKATSESLWNTLGSLGSFGRPEEEVPERVQAFCLWGELSATGQRGLGEPGGWLRSESSLDLCQWDRPHRPLGAGAFTPRPRSFRNGRAGRSPGCTARWIRAHRARSCRHLKAFPRRPRTSSRAARTPETDSRETDPPRIHSLVSAAVNLEPFPSRGC